jgi:phage terminase large subunit-like protein
MARKDDIIKLLEDQARAKRENKLKSFRPYPKQIDFIAATRDHSEVALRAGNQQGKSETAAYTVAVWLTGRYPKSWPGRVFPGPVKGWAAGESTQAVRDVCQRKLCGPPGDDTLLGTGFIPKDCIQKVVLGHGVGGAFDTVLVKHESGGVSELTFKSYDQDRAKWQGATLDFLWNDEEPPVDHYLEGLARLVATNGVAIATFTPLNGNALILPRFAEHNPARIVIAMTIDDAEHLKDPTRRAALEATFPAHQRKARLYGVPLLGSGAVFSTPEETIRCAPFELPPHFPLLWGIDPGMQHPFAAALIAWDRDTDTVYVAHCIRMSDALPLQQSEAMKKSIGKMGGRVPVAWPQDTTQRREFEGRLEPLAKIYKAHGLNMLAHHATFSDGSNSTELGILEMQERMSTNRFKVFETCPDWFEEFREYHRKDGQLVKVRDDLMSATRIGVMQLRSAKTVLFDPFRSAARNGDVPMAHDIDVDPWE